MLQTDVAGLDVDNLEYNWDHGIAERERLPFVLIGQGEITADPIHNKVFIATPLATCCYDLNERRLEWDKGDRQPLMNQYVPGVGTLLHRLRRDAAGCVLDIWIPTKAVDTMGITPRKDIQPGAASVPRLYSGYHNPACAAGNSDAPRILPQCPWLCHGSLPCGFWDTQCVTLEGSPDVELLVSFYGLYSPTIDDKYVLGVDCPGTTTRWNPSEWSRLCCSLTSSGTRIVVYSRAEQKTLFTFIPCPSSTLVMNNWDMSDDGDAIRVLLPYNKVDSTLHYIIG